MHDAAGTEGTDATSQGDTGGVGPDSFLSIVLLPVRRQAGSVLSVAREGPETDPVASRRALSSLGWTETKRATRNLAALDRAAGILVIVCVDLLR